MNLLLHKASVLSMLVGLMIVSAGCSGRKNHTSQADEESIYPQEQSVDSVKEERVPVPGDSDYKFEDPEEMGEYLDSGENAMHYKGGIMNTIAECVPEYAEKLIASKYSRFIVVDKASMRVLLYDRYGHIEREYDMACAKNYGTKHKKADSRTPEGFFSVEGIYNSTDWLYTDDEGVTSKKKGQFGPRFIRIKIPTTSQIGIHGTCSPWSIGHRTSHGCIRLTNEHILELVELVEPGMPVIILPGKRDRAVNREEGYKIPYFPTAPKYAMSASEKSMNPKTKEEIAKAEEESARLDEQIHEAAPEPEHSNHEEEVRQESEEIILKDSI